MLGDLTTTIFMAIPSFFCVDSLSLYDVHGEVPIFYAGSRDSMMKSLPFYSITTQIGPMIRVTIYKGE